MATKKTTKTTAAKKTAAKTKAAKTEAVPEAKAANEAAATGAAGEAKPKVSLVRAALEVLASTEEAMNTTQLVAAAKDRGLWTPGSGKTPAQTLYSAFTREIKAKGENARIALAGKGKFRLASR